MQPTYRSRFRKKALPEADFRYFSNALAVSDDSKVPYQTTYHGLNLEVYGDCPELCAPSRLGKLEVLP